MNGLEALKRLRQETAPTTYMEDFDKDECCDVIEKELKALEIIKNKNVDIEELKSSNSCSEYNQVYVRYRITGYKVVSQEEFDLLKEVIRK